MEMSPRCRLQCCRPSSKLLLCNVHSGVAWLLGVSRRLQLALLARLTAACALH
jgi:hypothetical protein